MHSIFQATTSTFLTPSIWGLAPALKHLPYGGLLPHSNNMILGDLLPSMLARWTQDHRAALFEHCHSACECENTFACAEWDGLHPLPTPLPLNCWFGFWCLNPFGLPAHHSWFLCATGSSCTRGRTNEPCWSCASSTRNMIRSTHTKHYECWCLTA